MASICTEHQYKSREHLFIHKISRMTHIYTKIYHFYTKICNFYTKVWNFGGFLQEMCYFCGKTSVLLTVIT